MIDLRGVKARLLQQLEATTESIRATEMPASVDCCAMTAVEIKNKDLVEQKASKLPKKGSHIYWIEVDKHEELLEQFRNRQITGDFKFARDNKNTNSNYVYIGSCTTTKLGSRFRQHCGHKDNKTYSLQLSRWISDSELVFTFCYFEIENKDLVQYIEDQLHSELKPLFGKSGGNNRIPKVSV
ncbi:GIY-YIG nuclease family protein [Spirosoma spitsbergense]|uniref:GIY-YIG nuclease family protein n=1 Tax=Spirosoma spitsbergense TaxID=431554 RepID=UPI00035FED4F|nr:GIY-YIG nuclease family protein [Spirosoma spitsbergense]